MKFTKHMYLGQHPGLALSTDDFCYLALRNCIIWLGEL